MEFISEDLSNYCENHSSCEDPVLSELSRECRSKMLYSRMLSGHLQGHLLTMFSNMLNPLRILEIGTYTAYSAICLAKGLRKNGLVHTIEINEEFEDFIRKYIKKAGMEDKIQLIIGNALDIIPNLQDEYDLVFIDADKENYLNYFQLIFDKVRKGGFIIADNVLWSGKVLNPALNDSETQAIVAFNNYIKERSDLENLILPFRDGLMIIRKK
ncbi:MAG: O-methyltransferase [Bacteroidales bacterium]|nr:O-methyltransferase [Bacteroidales bacterium]